MSRLSEAKYVKLNTHKCKGCWICIQKCPNNVFDKVGFLWHKHARIKNSTHCTGCNLCIKACPFKALSPVNIS